MGYNVADAGAVEPDGEPDGVHAPVHGREIVVAVEHFVLKVIAKSSASIVPLSKQF